MHFVTLNLCILFLAIFNSNKISGLKKELKGKIVGGIDTTIDEYPFLVSLQQVRFGHFCGGTILSTSWILTAGHCCVLRNKIRPKGCCYVVAGISDSVAISAKDAQRVDILGYVYHPKFDEKRFTNDIACIKLKSPLRLTNNVRPVNLSQPYIGDLVDVLRSGLAAGWGITEELWYNNNLKEVELPVISLEECRRRVRYPPVESNNVCTMLKYGDFDVSLGDSGGPLLSVHNKTQYGIVSFGRGCAGYNNPSVYIRVDKYLDFIDNCLSGFEPFSKTAGVYSPYENLICVISNLFLLHYFIPDL